MNDFQKLSVSLPSQHSGVVADKRKRNVLRPSVNLVNLTVYWTETERRSSCCEYIQPAVPCPRDKAMSVSMYRPHAGVSRSFFILQYTGITRTY